MKDEFFKDIQTLTRTRQLENKEGAVFFTKEEFIQHWKLRAGMKRKAAVALYKKEYNKSTALKRKSNRGTLLGVHKPPELNASDTLSHTRNIKGKGKAIGNKKNLQSISKGWGEGLDVGDGKTGKSAALSLKSLADDGDDDDDEDGSGGEDEEEEEENDEGEEEEEEEEEDDEWEEDGQEEDEEDDEPSEPKGKRKFGAKLAGKKRPSGVDIL